MEKLLTSHQLAKLLNVWPETLRRWEKEGKLIPLRTPGGHRRYKESQIKTLLGEEQDTVNNEKVPRPLIKRFIKAGKGFKELTNWKQWSAIDKAATAAIKKLKKGGASLVNWQHHKKQLLGMV